MTKRQHTTSPRFSVRYTQDVVQSANTELQQALQKVQECQQRLERAQQAHREQIARSLTSKDPEERRKAESIAEWWDVPQPTRPT